MSISIIGAGNVGQRWRRRSRAGASGSSSASPTPPSTARRAGAGRARAAGNHRRSDRRRRPQDRALSRALRDDLDPHGDQAGAGSQLRLRAAAAPDAGPAMNKNRLEAFSDGVLAIIITILVLELKIPHGEDFATLRPLLPVFLGYVLSLRLRRHLLEQPPPHAARREARRRRRAVGEPAPAVLAVAVPVRHRLDGGEPLRRAADGAVRRRAADGGDRLLHPAAAC